MSRCVKKKSCKSSCLSSSNARNEDEPISNSRNIQGRPQKLSFSEDHDQNESAEDSFYSANDSQIDQNNASYYSAEPGTPRNKQNLLRFAESSPKNQKSQQDIFYDNSPLPPVNRTLPPCCRTGQDSYGSRRGADMNSGYFDRNQANLSREADMSSGYFDRSQANSPRGPEMSSGYFDRSQVNASRAADMIPGYFDRSQVNPSRGTDMASGYFDRNQDISPRRADMSPVYGNRSKSNLSRSYISHPGSPFTHLNRNDTTPFSFLDESQPGRVDPSRCPCAAANASPRYLNQGPAPCLNASSQLNRNDTTPFSFLDDAHDESEAADMSYRYFNRSPGPPVPHLDSHDTSQLPDDFHYVSSMDNMNSQYNNRSPPALPNASYRTGSSYVHLGRPDNTPFSMLNDSNEPSRTGGMNSRYINRSPPRSNKSSSCSSFYTAHETQTDDIKDPTIYTGDPGSFNRNKRLFVKLSAQSTPKREIPQHDYFEERPQFSPISRTLPSSYRTGQDSYNRRMAADMNSSYFNRPPANSYRGADMNSGYYDSNQSHPSRGTDMNAGYFNRNNAYRPDSSIPGSPFTYISRNDVTPFSFLDESQLSSSDRDELISRYLNRSPGRSSPGSPFVHISRNDDNKECTCGGTEKNPRCPQRKPEGSPSVRSYPGNPNTPSASFFDKDQGNPIRVADKSSDHLDSTNDDDFSFINDANEYLQYYDSIPQKNSKFFYSAPNVSSNLK